MGENLFKITRKEELETQLIINQNLYDMKVIDYDTYQGFVNLVLAKLNKIQ